MTVLIGMKQDDYVLITGDTKMSHMNRSNQILETYESNTKIHPICENMIIGIAGSDRIGKAVIGAIKPIFSLNHKLSVKEMIQHLQKTAIFLHDMYKQVHTDEAYSILQLVVACIDHKENKSYLYSLSSTSEFVPVECKQDLQAYGVKPQQVKEFISANMSSNKYINDEPPIHLFSDAIRSIDDKMVSKDTITLILNKNKTAHILYVNEQGNIKKI
ncbi:Uncharacterized protein BC141101_05759 [Bacillus toyonensis]|uniref:hypothetical protein n=1 Tax=Bacillus toyonensis TaxID=155322 RepID=UPI00027BE910|nr:hypothetical protein [Bacillus toyonensis]EJV41963.1 hypothetical protein IEA_05462 [Bacillus toyonensis]EJV89987.1 hypothetical protein IGI_05501 [Bacillus toyonensis]EOP32170.1 hypothetical protein IG5_05616 [Bacillus toyonensis]MBE7138625.1 hypothetical protein [Bacillus toyonensis]MBE7166948.1 hypothetical protein [Bacillus toyonensis]